MILLLFTAENLKSLVTHAEIEESMDAEVVRGKRRRRTQLHRLPITEMLHEDLGKDAVG